MGLQYVDHEPSDRCHTPAVVAADTKTWVSPTLAGTGVSYRCPAQAPAGSRLPPATDGLPMPATDSLIISCPLSSDTMMLPTHALAGMALALPAALVFPELAGGALLAGFLGGVIPDLDLYVGHRRSLHFPVYYPALAVPALAVAALSPSPASVGVAFALAGAALHSVTDVLGGGLELRPWEGTSERAVYDHYRGRWLAPRRWVDYDGSPGDFLLSLALAAPLFAVTGDALSLLVAATAVVAAVYTAVRRLLPAVATALVGVLAERLPPGLLARVPDRYREGPSGPGAAREAPPASAPDRDRPRTDLADAGGE